MPAILSSRSKMLPGHIIVLLTNYDLHELYALHIRFLHINPRCKGNDQKTEQGISFWTSSWRSAVWRYVAQQYPLQAGTNLAMTRKVRVHTFERQC